MIGYGGGDRAPGRSPRQVRCVGQVRSARRPPELVIANGRRAVLVRIASVTMSPTSDSQSRPAVAAALVGARDRLRSTVPICVPRIGASCGVQVVDLAWMAGSGVTPIVHGLWKSAVL